MYLNDRCMAEGLEYLAVVGKVAGLNPTRAMTSLFKQQLIGN